MKTTMKKITLVWAFIALFAGTSFAQFRLGPAVGFNFATLMEKDVENDFVFGLRGGLTFDIGVAKFLSVVPEVNFSQMGWKYIGEGQDEGITETGRLNYIQVHLNLVFKLKMGRNGKFLIFPGIYGAYAISGNLKVKSVGYDTQTSKAPFGTNP